MGEIIPSDWLSRVTYTGIDGKHSQKTTPQEKSWVEDGSGKEREKVALRREKGALHKRKQSYQVVKGAKPLRRIAG